MKFIGYHIDDDNSSIPVATGVTRDEVMAKTIRRVLSIGATWGAVDVQDRSDDVSDDEFAALSAITEDWAAKNCGLAA